VCIKVSPFEAVSLAIAFSRTKTPITSARFPGHLPYRHRPASDSDYDRTHSQFAVARNRAALAAILVRAVRRQRLRGVDL
jgi:hypothetical protein